MKTFLKSILLFNMIFAGTWQLSAQQNTIAAGGLATGSGGTASYSIGQIDYITATGSGGTASQGVQQPYKLNLDLKYFIQGYYAGGGLMQKVLYNEGIDLNPASTNVDSVTIELHNISAPFAIAHTFTGLLKTNGSIACTFPSASEGSSYYVVLKHRNSVETWSASPVTLSNVVYDFTTAANKAYGSNQILMAPSVYAVYNGDINQDQNVDLIDLASVETDINNFAFGYVVTDINGDGNVDLLDGPVVEENVNNFVFAVHP